MSLFLTPSQSSGYRADIDGLRAIAVLAVVLFHIDPNWLPGGFAGVDIFFVISGFLITGNIIREADSAKGFSFQEFYRRRALRIIPALAVVVLSTLVAGHFILLPEDLLELGYSAAASVFSIANIYFTYFLDTSYFADDSNLQPLLHLWSLGVEEQFYLFWPVLLLLLLGRLSRAKLLLFTLLIITLSFCLAEALLSDSPMFAYYMLPTRAGELLLGALAAIWLSDLKKSLPLALCYALAVLGLVLVVFSLVWIHEDMGFPGVNALPATVGATLMIVAGSQGGYGVNRILALKPLVFVGLLSYSLYLWHWPVLAYYRYIYGEAGPEAGIALFGLMFALSYLSYLLVEKPLRRLKWDFFRVSTVVVGGTTALVVSLVAGLFVTKGFGLYQFDEGYKAALLAEQPSPAAYSYPYVCQRPELRASDLTNVSCVINGKDEPQVLLWGDSNAAHYVGVVAAIAEVANFSFRNIAHSSCPPVFTAVDKMVTPSRAQACIASLRLVEKNIDKYSTLILGAAWASYFSRNPEFSAVITDTVKKFAAQGKKVVILGQIPALSAVDRKCVQKAIKVSTISCREQGDALDEGDLPSNKFLADLAATTPGVDYFDVRSFLCIAGACSAYVGDTFIYYDKSHLSMEGSWVVGRKVLTQGVPDAFISLKSEGSAGAMQAQGLQARLLLRGRERFDVVDTEWSTLLESGAVDGWSGGAGLEVNSSLKGLLIQDAREDKFDVLNYKFSPSHYSPDIQQDYALLAKMEVSDCLGGYPMLRFWLNGSRTDKFDVILDCQTGKIKVKGQMGRQDAFAEKTVTGYMVHAYVPVSLAAESAMVTIYPASGTAFGKYSQQAVGGVVLKSLRIAGVAIQ